MSELTCATCQFWWPVAHTTLGDCDLKVVYGRTPFDYQPCAYHSERGKVEEHIALQSAARGMTVQEWQAKLMGKM